MKRFYEITPRKSPLGGGWNLKLFDENGQEAGGGAFPLGPYLEEARKIAEAGDGKQTIEAIARGIALEDADQEARDWTGEYDEEP